MKKKGCTSCGQCCVNPIININLPSEDVARFYQGFGIDVIKIGDVFQAKIYIGTVCKYLIKNPDGTAKCSIYEQRPQMCREYPKKDSELHDKCGYK